MFCLFNKKCVIECVIHVHKNSLVTWVKVRKEKVKKRKNIIGCCSIRCEISAKGEKRKEKERSVAVVMMGNV